MNICYICSEYPPGTHGGIGTVTRLLSRALVRAGHGVRVAGIYGASYEGLSRMNDEGVDVWRLSERAHRLSWLRARHELYNMVSSWAKQGEIDIIEAPDWAGPVAGWPRLPVPVIVRAHGSGAVLASEQQRPARSLHVRMEKASLRRADYWCSVSRYVGDKTRTTFHLSGGPDAVLYNGVEIHAPGSCPREQGKVVYAGTISAMKGVSQLVKAWPLVLDQCPAARLHMFGRDEARRDGESMTQAIVRGLSDTIRQSVVFHGFVPREDLLREFQRANVAVFPSFVEAFSLVPIESMAAGCPIVYTRRASGPEVLDDGVEGILVDPGDPEEIASALIRLLRDQAFAERMGEAGRKRVQEKFTLAKVIPQNVEFYEHCISLWNQ